MSRFQIGPAALMIPDHAGRTVDVEDFQRPAVLQPATQVAAAVSAPGVLLEIGYHRWANGGGVWLLDRGDSSTVWDRLSHGARMTVVGRDDGYDFVEANLLDWDVTKGANGWGNPKSSTLAELDGTLGGESAPLLVESGAQDIGTRGDLFGDPPGRGSRRNRLAVKSVAEDPRTPLVAYVLTRILPILNAGVA